MSDKTQIMLSLPVDRFTVSAGYVMLKQASGLDYLLLKMIEYGRGTDPKLKISELMGLFSIADDMVPMVLKGISSLHDNGLIQYSLDRVTKDTAAGRIEFTEKGNEMCQKSYTIGENGRLEQRMLHFPVREEPFELDDGFESVRDLPVQGKVDADAVSKFVLDNRELFKLHPEAQIVSRIRVNDERTGYYKQPVIVDYDENEALFHLKDSLGVSPEKLIASGISAKDIIPQIPEEFFGIPESAQISVRWQDEIPDIRCGHVLPHNFKIGEGIIAVNRDVVASDYLATYDLPAGTSYHLAHIAGDNKGRKYWFVRYNVKVDGISDEVPVNMILRQKMNEDEVRQLSESLKL